MSKHQKIISIKYLHLIESLNQFRIFCKVHTLRITPYLFFVLTFVLAGCSGLEKNIPVHSDITSLSKGIDSFVFARTVGTSKRPVKVYYFNPVEAGSEQLKMMPVLFIMHGLNRNAVDYLEDWVRFSKENHILLIAPQFSTKYYPNSNYYNLGNMFDYTGSLNDRSLWSFQAIEDIFDEILSLTDNKSQSYSIFGHSAGGQFVHRFVTFYPEARINLAISANSGWYTTIDKNMDFPYGLKNSQVRDEKLSDALSKKLVLLLGTEDTNKKGKSLRRTDEAMQQGAHRFERGYYYYQSAKDYATEHQCDYSWKLVEVPGVGHNHTEMANAASKLLHFE